MAGILKRTQPLYTHPRLEADIMGCMIRKKIIWWKVFQDTAGLQIFDEIPISYSNIIYMPKTINHTSI